MRIGGDCIRMLCHAGKAVGQPGVFGRSRNAASSEPFFGQIYARNNDACFRQNAATSSAYRKKRCLPGSVSGPFSRSARRRILSTLDAEVGIKRENTRSSNRNRTGTLGNVHPPMLEKGG